MMKKAILILLLLSSCFHKQEVLDFDLDYVYSTNKYNFTRIDSGFLFIKYLRLGDSLKAKNILPTIYSIDIANYLDKNGDYKISNAIDLTVLENPNSSIEIASYAVLLRYRYNCNANLYDQVLRGCIEMDMKNYTAIMLLAQHRYLLNYKSDALFLINFLFDRIKNEGLKQLKRNLEKEATFDGSIDMETFLSKEIHVSPSFDYKDTPS